MKIALLLARRSSNSIRISSSRKATGYQAPVLEVTCRQTGCRRECRKVWIGFFFLSSGAFTRGPARGMSILAVSGTYFSISDRPVAHYILFNNDFQMTGRQVPLANLLLNVPFCDMIDINR